MALSLRKTPKFRRKDYRRLGQSELRDCDNEYIFSESQADTAVDSSEETVLEFQTSSARNRHGLSRRRDHEENYGRNLNRTQDFLTYEIKPEDTLQGIALKYGCSVAELKRFNNLLQDQDAFALREIRIPAREHSILFEIFSQPNGNCTSGTHSSKTFHVSIHQMMQKDSEKEPSQFLKEMDRDIQHIVEKAQNQQTLDFENQTANAVPVIQPLIKPYYDGSNWGINWFCLLVVLLVVSVLAPVTYGIYFATVAHGHDNSTKHR